MPNTLLLDRTAWDLVLDSSGNIALAGEPYALAQDVASAVRLFLGELWYDTTKGVPYCQQILGERPPMALVKAAVVKAAMTVPNVAAARCLIASFKDRSITGQVQFKPAAGVALPPASDGFSGQLQTFDGAPIVTFDGYYLVSF